MKETHAPKTILTVNTDEEILAVTKLILENEGYKAVSLSNFGLILPTIQKHKPALLLIDVYGIAYAKKIKEVKAFCDLPIILFSSVPRLAELSKELNVDGYVEHPYEISTLIPAIENLFSKTKAC